MQSKRSLTLAALVELFIKRRSLCDERWGKNCFQVREIKCASRESGTRVNRNCQKEIIPFVHREREDSNEGRASCSSLSLTRWDIFSVERKNKAQNFSSAAVKLPRFTRFMYRSPLAFTPSRLKVVFPHSFKSTKSCTVKPHNFKHCEHLPASSQRETRCSTARWRHLLDSSLQTHRFTRKRVNIKSVSTSLELRSCSVAARRNAATHQVSKAGNLSCSVLLILLCTTSLSKRKGWLGKN